MSAINISHVSITNVHDQTTVQVLYRHARESGTDLDFKTICSLVESSWSSLAEDFNDLPADLSGERMNVVFFKKSLILGLYKFRDDMKRYFYGTRFDHGDQLSISQMLIVMVYIMEGLQVHTRGIYNRTDPVSEWGFTYLDLEKIATKISEMSHVTLVQLDQRLLLTADAADLMLRIIATLEDTMRIIGRHPAYTVAMFGDPNSEYSVQRATLVLVIDSITTTMRTFSNADGTSHGPRATSYGVGIGSDEIAVRGLRDMLQKVSTNLRDRVQQLVDSSIVIEPQTILASASWFQTQVVNLQVQLFQRLRPENLPCIETIMMALSSQRSLLDAGELRTDSEVYQFWCRTCESNITWPRRSEDDGKPTVRHERVLWKSSRSGDVHDRYAVEHHLPASSVNGGNTLPSHQQWKGKGEARLYCGYCCEFAPGRAVDSRVVFDDMEKFKRHLSEFHDAKEDGCCEIM